MRFHTGMTQSMQGVQELQESVIAGLVSVGIVTGALTRSVVYGDGGALTVFDGTNTTDITKELTTYNEDLDNPFEFLMYNGYLLAHNGLGITQVWNPETPAALMVDLPNWDPTHLATKIRPFGPFLMALGMQKSTDLFPHMIKWSSPAEPGALPSTWDESDPTNEAGEFTFADTQKGSIRDGRELADRFYIYKRGAIWAMSFVGGVDVFSRDKVSEEVGLELPRSLITIPMPQGDAHFFVGQQSFYIMDGLKPSPVFEGVFKDEFLRLVNTQYLQRCFSVLNRVNNEVWFCFPEHGEETCTLAFVWNYYNNSFSIKELSGTVSIATGFGVTEDSDTILSPLSFSDDTYFSDGSGFFDTQLVYSEPVIFEASHTLEKVYRLERGDEDYTGAKQESYVERRGLAATGDPDNPIDFQLRKLVKSIVPKLKSGSLQLQVGVQERDQQEITWSAKYAIDPLRYRVDLVIPMSGRFINFRFYNIPGSNFEMAGFDYDIELLGEF